MVRVNSVNIDQHITKGYPTRFRPHNNSPHLILSLCALLRRSQLRLISVMIFTLTHRPFPNLEGQAMQFVLSFTQKLPSTVAMNPPRGPRTQLV